ncbi:hypothetical protein LCL96_09065 [Rossellomorea aquimaris]|uniref:coiled-coil domain-containing protein n=1 Tax=Rossellomorea aquimaris TaxID=189382 RepID=UPI001CD33E06|nr:hypothetical protein [Rossellomorea aquimaris]MCA1059085.1 hypothetical protein [Rossellomorea aquimaris]
MNEEESKSQEIPGVLKDIHLISEELESLYNHYSNRIRRVSEELSRERSKHKVYQLEIAENHHTIQLLTEQIEYLLQNLKVKHELNIQLQNELKIESLQDDLKEISLATATRYDIDEGNSQGDSWEVSDHTFPSPIPEIRVIYESIENHKKTLLEKIKNDAISLLVEANRCFFPKGNMSIEVEEYSNTFSTQLEWLRKQRKQYTVGKNERWYSKMWKFLWGKEENNHPEILKKLDLIEEQLVSYSSKFNEVKETLNMDNTREEITQNFLQKTSDLHAELKKIEEHYEEELHALKSQIEDFKQRESHFERQMDLFDEQNKAKQSEKNQREIELEQELVKLRQDLKSQSNKKNDLYNKMKQQKKQTPQVNTQFEEYGNIPMSSESKRTIFNPNKYIR